MLGFTGTFAGRPISVQSTGMGCPSAAIVFEELIQLGAKRLLRIGTCGALQPGMAMADTVVAVSATPSDRTALTYTAGEPHAPTADWRVVEAAARIGRERGLRVHVGPIVSSDVFYDPDTDRFRRWAERGHLGVEMEAAVLFTIAALRKVSAGTLLTVSDTLYGEQIVAHQRRRAEAGRRPDDGAGRARARRHRRRRICVACVGSSSRAPSTRAEVTQRVGGELRSGRAPSPRCARRAARRPRRRCGPARSRRARGPARSRSGRRGTCTGTTR